MEKETLPTREVQYRRHEPEKTLLYQIIANNLESWLADRQAEGGEKGALPRFVEKELRAFLACGILSEGFVLVKCDDGCGKMFAVAYSCKHRGFCPSCAAKRMNETAIHLTENVLPHVPFRQWVITFPIALRYWMAASRKLTSLLHRIVIKMIMHYYLHQAEERGIEGAQPGGMTFLQRFGGALNLHPHGHILMIEGVYAAVDGVPKFFHLPGPSNEEVGQVLEAISAAVIDALRRRKMLPEEGEEIEASTLIDKIFGSSDSLASAANASGRMRIAFGERTGQKVRRIGRGFGFEEEIPLAKGSRCSSINGFSLHADRYIGLHEREKLRDLVCYAARGAFSNDRLALNDPNDPDGDLVYLLKTPWADGTEGIVLSASEILEKLVALIPPPNSHLTRYFGVLSSHSKMRSQIILKPGVTKGFVTELGETEEEMIVRLTWARMLMRTFKLDVLRCPACGARIKSRNCVAVNDLPSIRRILRYLGLSEHPPPISPARRLVNEPGIDQRHPD